MKKMNLKTLKMAFKIQWKIIQKKILQKLKSPNKIKCQNLIVTYNL